MGRLVDNQSAIRPLKKSEKNDIHKKIDLRFPPRGHLSVSYLVVMFRRLSEILDDTERGENSPDSLYTQGNIIKSNREPYDPIFEIYFYSDEAYTQRNNFEILSNQTDIRLYLRFSDWLGTVNGQCPFDVPNQSENGKYNLMSV